MTFVVHEASSGAAAMEMRAQAATRGQALRRRVSRLADAGHGRHGDGAAHPRAADLPRRRIFVMVTAYGREEVLKQAEDTRHRQRAGEAGDARRCCSTPP